MCINIVNYAWVFIYIFTEGLEWYIYVRIFICFQNSRGILQIHCSYPIYYGIALI